MSPLPVAIIPISQQLDILAQILACHRAYASLLRLKKWPISLALRFESHNIICPPSTSLALDSLLS
jgi:hypothetical protein